MTTKKQQNCNTVIFAIVVITIIILLALTGH
jgi:hypothetical protein